MTINKFALGGAAALALASLAAPASAFTHHPATPAEIQQTDQLNAQALANAQGNGTVTNASSGTVSGGMMTGASMNAGGATTTNTNTNTNTNVQTPPQQDQDTTTPPDNGH